MAIRFTLRQLEYFVAVGEAGSIAAASERINISPPSISAAVAQLEAEFGIELFVRQHAQGLSLTPGGRRFFNTGKALRVSGKVAPGTLDIRADRSGATFTLCGASGRLPAECPGPLPDNLAEEMDVVVEGRLSAEGHLAGERVLTRCASKYEAEQE